MGFFLEASNPNQTGGSKLHLLRKPRRPQKRPELRTSSKRERSSRTKEERERGMEEEREEEHETTIQKDITCFCNIHKMHSTAWAEGIAGTLHVHSSAVMIAHALVCGSWPVRAAIRCGTYTQLSWSSRADEIRYGAVGTSTSCFLASRLANTARTCPAFSPVFSSEMLQGLSRS